MFDLRIPASWASLPGRRHVCQDDDLYEYHPAVQKKCACCGEVKPEDDFSGRREGGLRSYCKVCAAAKARAWNHANRERINARKKA